MLMIKENIISNVMEVEPIWMISYMGWKQNNYHEWPFSKTSLFTNRFLYNIKDLKSVWKALK